jgi:hypothetical protein
MLSPVSQPSSSEQAAISPSREPISSLIEETGNFPGLAFLALKNEHELFAIPSSKNFVGGIQFRNVIVDGGCAKMLLKISNTGTLAQIVELFGDPSRYTISIRRSVGANGNGSALVITCVDERETFRMLVGADLFGDASSCDVRLMRFQLSSEHAAYILSQPSLSSAFSASDRAHLEDYRTKNIPEIPVSLLGNAVCDLFTEVKRGTVRYFFVSSQCSALNLLDLGRLSSQVRDRLDEPTKQAIAMLEFDLADGWGSAEGADYDF